MPIKGLVALRQEKEGPLLAETFDARTIREMELALLNACKALTPEMDNHDHRRYIAAKIVDRVRQGDCTFAEMVLSAMGAIEALKRHRDFV